ncbi:MAG: hypothetical protein IPG81_23385 [Sandaracinaceae bacterium]|nr:hypothetical protein [Sandaracinaceae bacterium]
MQVVVATLPSVVFMGLYPTLPLVTVSDPQSTATSQSMPEYPALQPVQPVKVPPLSVQVPPFWHGLVAQPSGIGSQVGGVLQLPLARQVTSPVPS